MHARAMTLLKKDRGVDVRDYAPIARALNMMDEEKMKRKFKVAFRIAKNNIGMTK